MARHRRVLHAAADRSTTRSAPADDGDRLLTFPSAFITPHPENNTCTAGSSRAAPQRSRAAVLVLPQWNSDAGRPRRPVPDPRVERHERAAPQPAVSRSADAARAPARRLHRQLQRRADRAGVPPGGARRAARDCSGWRRKDTNGSASSGTSLGFVPRAVDHGARAADPGAGAQSHLAVLRRRRLARPLDASTCARDSTATSSSICSAALWKPISPRWYLERLRDRQTLLVYARYDLTFPVDLSEDLVQRVPRAAIPHEVAVAALRPLQHRQSAVQIRRRLGL